jgi:ribosomal protein L11 methyltransferase
VLDVGTGSGILAIAAARLGAARVVAIDTDPIAVEAAVANVTRNGLAGSIDLRCTPIDGVTGRYGMIVANLYSALLTGMFRDFAAHAERGAILVVSGLLDADREAVSQAAVRDGWRDLATRSLEGWTTLRFRAGGSED